MRSKVSIVLVTILFCVAWAIEASAATASYTYDNLYRLTKVDYGNGTVIEYTYDAAGNRLILSSVTPTVQITVDTLPTGLQINVDGTSYTAPHVFSWDINSQHILSASSPQSGGTGTQYIFDSWSDGGSQSHIFTVPLSNATYTASFKTQYALTTIADPSNSGSFTVNPVGLSAPCIALSGYNCYWYDTGTSVTITNSANTGYMFSNWSGNADCLDGSVTMNVSMTCTATFKLQTNNLTVNKAGNGTGTIISSPTGINCGTDCSESYTRDTTVKLTATPGNESTFDGWGGDADCFDDSVTMDNNKTCTAMFKLKTYNLTITKTGTGSGTVTSNSAGIDCGTDCLESYNSGEIINLTATPSSDSTFAGWSGDTDCADGGVTMDAGKTCTAMFNLKAFGLKGEYYDNADLGNLMFTRLDPVIDFNWGSDSPDQSIDPEIFSVRWTGSVKADYNEDYTFNALTDDGVRLWIDGFLIIDYWQTGEASSNGIINLSAGLHDIKMEFYEDTGNASVQIYWSSSSTPYGIIPKDHLLPPGSDISPLIEWVGNTGYTSDGLEPESGDASTVFTYKVKYKHLIGFFPMGGYPRVHILKSGKEISGSPFVMNPMGGDPSDGAIYYYSIKLPSGIDYSYYFDAKSEIGLQAVATSIIPTPTAPLRAPVVGEAIMISGDIDRSGRIDGFDLGRMGIAYGSKPGDVNWYPEADLNGDGIVDGSDISILSSQFGKTK